MSTVLLVIGVWFVLAAVFTYVLLTLGMRRDDRESRADLDAELRHLIDQHRT